jgi:hypothetical protein
MKLYLASLVALLIASDVSNANVPKTEPAPPHLTGDSSKGSITLLIKVDDFVIQSFMPPSVTGRSAVGDIMGPSGKPNHPVAGSNPPTAGDGNKSPVVGSMPAQSTKTEATAQSQAARPKVDKPKTLGEATGDFLASIFSQI